jgi:peroxiredoxin
MQRSFLGAGILVVALAQTALAGLAVGDKLTPFKLPEAAGPEFDLGSLAGKKAVVVLFIATQCPVSNAYNERMAALAKEYSAKGVAVVGINSNKQESAAEVVEHAKAHGFDFTILKDAGNLEADRFGALVTPEAYVFDPTWTLRYHGRVDDDRSGRNVTSPDLRNALDALLAGRDVPVKETKAFGCTIKRVDKAPGA